MIKRFPQSPCRSSILPRQEGFTMILTLLVLLITSGLLVAAFTATNGEIHLTSTDTSQKKAYYAAEAGIDNYEYHLTQDGNYLTFCTSPTPANPALNQVGHNTNRATVPSTSGEPTHEEYAIQLLPAESSSEKKCNPNNIVGTMVEEQGPATGTFRIESTGYSGKAERTVVATFRNANFVSYVWYTKYETGDPAIYGKPPASEPNYFTECGQFYPKRPAQGGSPLRCLNNFFINGESVNGPLHTADHGGVCGSPTFGRDPHDRIEFGNGGNTSEKGYSGEGICGESAPKFVGTYVPPNEVLSIEPPPGDEELKHIVETSPKDYLYEGKTEIVLEGERMSVSKWKEEPATKTFVKTTESGVEFPPNGVIYVAGSCSAPYSPFGPKPGYTEDYSCGNAYVHGKYTKSLTIAAENDLVINGNVLTPTEPEDSPTGVPTTNALLGLIANNFVRIYHPVETTYTGHGTNNTTCNSGDTYNSTLKKCEYTDSSSGCDAPNAETEDLKEPIIYAGILAVKHAVIVDNFNCGLADLNHLNIYGAVAGLYTNGFTGEFSGSSIVHGYPYDANYDNRLQVEEPPHFLNPIEAAWYIQRQTLAPKNP